MTVMAAAAAGGGGQYVENSSIMKDHTGTAFCYAAPGTRAVLWSWGGC